MRIRWRKAQRAILGTVLFCLPGITLAETLAMPDRDGLVGEDVVFWGVTDQAGNYTLDCGNGTTVGPAAITDGSYIATVCNYGAQGTFTATLTVGAESDTADVAIFDGAALSAIDLRGVRVNMAIEDGLRWLWVNQDSRAAGFPASPTTRWGTSSGYSSATTSIVTLAFQNQGYQLANDGSPPIGIYEKYAVQRGLNHVIASQTTVPLGVTPQGDNPCVGTPAADACTGLYDRQRDVFHQSYTTGVAVLAVAGSGALSRTVAAADVPGNLSGGYVVGKTYGEILQRMSNALAWGQIDAGVSSGDRARGGWYYNFNSSSSDGSTIGWVILAILDAEAAGAIVPAWVKSEFGLVFGNLNTDGSIDYQADGNPAFNSSVGPAKNGIGLQGLALIGELAGARVAAGTNIVDSWWNNGTPGIGGDSWRCRGAGQNHGCGYAMYNNFKGLKLHGIQTLSNVARPAGPGAIPAGDWHEDYKDWLLANQVAPNTVNGGGWGPPMKLSAIMDNDAFETGLAELLLSPVALVLPDPVTFGEIGLQHCLDGAPCTDRTPEVDGDSTEDTNPVGTAHNVVARALSINGDPIPGTTINIDILSGPNAPANFQGVSNANGEVQIEYTSEGTAGTDEIQASIGNLRSNLLTKVWEADEPQKCDMDGDGDIDRLDISQIFGLRGTYVPPSPATADLDDNGLININDGRGCVLLCTLPRCASPPD